MRTRERRLAPLGVTVLVFLLAACGSSRSGSRNSSNNEGQSSGVVGAAAPQSSAAPNGTTPASQASGPADACQLVTPAEAQAALGKAVRPGKSKLLGPNGQGASCTYETTDFANGTAAGLALTITFFPHTSMAKAQFDAAYSGNGFRAVSGLGDGAWYRGGILNVYAHGATLGVTIVSLNAEATAAQLEPVTRLALTRI